MLDEHAASLESKGNHILRLESRLPHFITLSDDALSSNITIYTFKEGITRIGRDLSSRDDPDEELEEGTDCDDEIPPQDIYICGPGTEPEHAIIEFTVEHNTELNSLVEIVVLHPIADECFVDGDRLEDSVTLCQGNVVQLGQTNIFRFNHPTEAARMRKERNQSREPMSFKTASKLVSMFAVSSLNVSGTSSQLSMLESNANSTNNETSVENLAIVEDQEIELQRMRETEAEEELKRKQEFLENERAMLQAEKVIQSFPIILSLVLGL